MKVRLKDESGKLWPTTLEAILAGTFPARSLDGPPIVGYDVFYFTTRDGTDIFVGDTVLVQGTKKYGKYETTVIERNGDPCLSLNKTIFVDTVAKHCIISKV